MWVDRLGPSVGVWKIGLQLYLREGRDVVRGVRARSSLPIFLDLKLHDIPETVEQAIGSLGDLGVDYLTVHASGGKQMLERAARKSESSNLRILAVTALTSLSEDDLSEIGWGSSSETVKRLATLATSAGVTAFVCSPNEITLIRDVARASTIFTPGIRSDETAEDDQSRTASAFVAAKRGADFLVIGRPIRNANDPVAAAGVLAREIERGRSS